MLALATQGVGFRHLETAPVAPEWSSRLGLHHHSAPPVAPLFAGKTFHGKATITLNDAAAPATEPAGQPPGPICSSVCGLQVGNPALERTVPAINLRLSLVSGSGKPPYSVPAILSSAVSAVGSPG